MQKNSTYKINYKDEQKAITKLIRQTKECTEHKNIKQEHKGKQCTMIQCKLPT